MLTSPGELEAVRAALGEAGLAVASAEIAQVARNTVELDEQKAAQTLRLLDQLDELDDVSRVYSNADFSDEALAAAGLGA